MASQVEEKAKQLTDLRLVIVSSLGFVIGLFWNDAIRSAIEQIIPQGEGLFYKFLAAVVVTVVVVIIIYIIMNSQRLAEHGLKGIKLKKKAQPNPSA